MILSQKNVLAFVLAAGSQLAHGQVYELVWSDEFNGTELSEESWEYQIGSGTAYGLPAGWGNNELQYYTNFSRNVDVSNGTLKINAINESFGGRNYTSARIRTMGNHEFLYGRIEGRIKLPSTSGVWPAFWMLPTDSPYGGWAASGEIDVMESVNLADRVYGTIHHGSNFPNNQYNGNSINNGTDFSEDFHIYTVEWEPDEIRWYLDGQQFHSVTMNQWFSTSAPSNPRAPFDSEFHLLLNVAVGGNFPGNPDGSANYPQTMEVDYVRVYQQLQSPFNGTPTAVPGIIEAEDFDNGINGQSYNDCDPSNNGLGYRDTGVDIQTATENGFNVGWICEGEWIEYTVDVQQAGTYTLDARVSSFATGGAFHFEIDGQDITGPMSFARTNGWQNWTTVSAEVELEAGVQVIRFVNDSLAGQEYNFNYFELTQEGGCSGADVAQPFGELDFFDVSAFLSLFGDSDPSADLTGDGSFDFFDVSQFLTIYGQGCP